MWQAGTCEWRGRLRRAALLLPDEGRVVGRGGVASWAWRAPDPAASAAESAKFQRGAACLVAVLPLAAAATCGLLCCFTCAVPCPARCPRIPEPTHAPSRPCRYLKDVKVGKGLSLAQALAAQLGPKLQSERRFSEDDLTDLLQKVPIKLGGGKLTAALADVVPSGCMRDFERACEDYARSC